MKWVTEGVDVPVSRGRKGHFFLSSGGWKQTTRNGSSEVLYQSVGERRGKTGVEVPVCHEMGAIVAVVVVVVVRRGEWHEEEEEKGVKWLVW